MRQALLLTLLNLRTIPKRVGQSFAVCIGVAGTVAVLVSILAMATGIDATLAQSAHADRALILRTGANYEVLSSLSRESVLAIETAPGIARFADGSIALSPEVFLTVRLPRADDESEANVTVRGWTKAGVLLNSEVAIVDGRHPVPGLQEIVVGRLASQRFDNLHLGGVARFYNADWTVVGIAESDGGAAESAIIADAITLMSAAGRTLFNTVTVLLESERSLEVLKDSLESNPRLKVTVHRQSDFFRQQSDNAGQIFYVLAYVIGSIMALGAFFGTLNTMYTAIGVRTAEIATLRAIGFGSFPVVISVLVEAISLTIFGALMGVTIAWLFIDGNTFGGFSAVGSALMELEVGITLLSTGVIWACAIGLLGGILAAWRAARKPIPDGLRVVA